MEFGLGEEQATAQLWLKEQEMQWLEELEDQLLEELEDQLEEGREEQWLDGLKGRLEQLPLQVKRKRMAFQASFMEPMLTSEVKATRHQRLATNRRSHKNRRASRGKGIQVGG